MKEKRSCINCKVTMKPSKSHYKGISFDSFQCPKCKTKIFTEELAHKAIQKLESQRLKNEYEKKAIKIGNSWGLTFPKDIVDVFKINSKMKFKLISKLKKGKIELIIQ